MLQIGSVVDRKYKILSEVGHGGMSVVYLAINERANKTWAIKEVRKDGVVDFEAVKQGLVVETDMLKKLNHPHLPSIIDVIDTDDSFLIVMDYIEGKSLQSVLKSGGAQPLDRVVEWGKQLCDVLGYLHSREPAIIYRDMKPANVMLKPDGNITLIDFGTAREFKNRTKVEDTTCLGTRGYAAPEQFGGLGETDGRTDIYCLGATLYHLLTGHSPADPPYEIKPLSYWDPSYEGTGIEKLINKCCQQDPGARYQDCEELMYALEHLEEENEREIRKRKRKWAAFITSAAVLLVGLLGMLGFGLAKRSAQSQTYEYYVQMAKKAVDLSEIESNCRSAMKISPTKRDAYDVLISRITEDARFTEEEMNTLNRCLNDGSPRHNLEYLRAGSPEAYDDLEYQIGMAYFFLCGNQQSYISASASHFETAKDSKNLLEGEAELSESLYRIATGYAKLTGEAGKYNTRTGYTFRNYWTDLDYIVDSDIQLLTGKASLAIAVNSLVAVQLNNHFNNFTAAGVSKENIGQMLDKVNANLDKIVMSPDEEAFLQSDMKNARSAVEAAYNLVRSESTRSPD